MGDGVLGPAVGGLAVEGAAPSLLGLSVGAAFLAAEGMHAENKAVIGIVAAPCRQGAFNAAAQIVAVAEEKIRQMTDLQGQKVAGIFGEQMVQAATHTVPVARHPGAQRIDMHALAVVAPVIQIVEPFQAGLDFRDRAAFPQGQIDLGP